MLGTSSLETPAFNNQRMSLTYKTIFSASQLAWKTEDGTRKLLSSFLSFLLNMSAQQISLSSSSSLPSFDLLSHKMLVCSTERPALVNKSDANKVKESEKLNGERDNHRLKRGFLLMPLCKGSSNSDGLEASYGFSSIFKCQHKHAEEE